MVEASTQDQTVPVARLPYKTYREYFDDSYKFVSSGKLEDMWKSEKGENEFVLVFDKTIFHPQGGGQPSDEGFITTQDGSVKFTISALQSKDDAILHFGKFDQVDQTFEKGAELIHTVNEEKRRACAKSHSAGHLLDIAMQRVGIRLQPGKGYHFLDGAYVEYIGVLDASVKDTVKDDLNAACRAIIKDQPADAGVFSKIIPYEEAQKVLKDGVPPYMPVGLDTRVLKLTEEDPGCPCGGTHIKHVSDIEELIVTKVIKKGKNTRVSYTVK